MPVTFTDLFNEALDDLVSTLSAVSGLQVVNDPRNLVPPCVFIDAPTFEAFNFNIVKMLFPVRCITLGPNNLDAQRSLMNLAAKVIGAKVGVQDGRPTIAVIGGAEYPAYEVSNHGDVRRILGGQGAKAGKFIKWHLHTSNPYYNPFRVGPYNRMGN